MTPLLQPLASSLAGRPASSMLFPRVAGTLRAAHPSYPYYSVPGPKGHFHIHSSSVTPFIKTSAMAFEKILIQRIDSLKCKYEEHLNSLSYYFVLYVKDTRSEILKMTNANEDEDSFVRLSLRDVCSRISAAHPASKVL